MSHCTASPIVDSGGSVGGAGWQAVARWVEQEREAQARDRVLAAHRQAQEQELEWRTQRYERVTMGVTC